MRFDHVILTPFYLPILDNYEDKNVLYSDSFYETFLTRAVGQVDLTAKGLLEGLAIKGRV